MRDFHDDPAQREPLPIDGSRPASGWLIALASGQGICTHAISAMLYLLSKGNRANNQASIRQETP